MWHHWGVTVDRDASSEVGIAQALSITTTRHHARCMYCVPLQRASSEKKTQVRTALLLSFLPASRVSWVLPARGFLFGAPDMT